MLSRKSRSPANEHPIREHPLDSILRALLLPRERVSCFISEKIHFRKSPASGSFPSRLISSPIFLPTNLTTPFPTGVIHVFRDASIFGSYHPLGPPYRFPRPCTSRLLARLFPRESTSNAALPLAQPPYRQAKRSGLLECPSHRRTDRISSACP